jgi:polyketide synthase PksN
MKKSFDTVIRGDHPILANHRVKGKGLMPGLAYVDMLYAMAGRALGLREGSHTLRRMAVHHPVALEAGDRLAVRFVFAGDDGASAWDVRMESRGAGVPAGTLLLAAELAAGSASGPVSGTPGIDPEAWIAGADRRVDLEDIYSRARETGLVHAGPMRARGAAHFRDGLCLIEVSLPEGSDTGYRYHPALLDGAAMASGALLEAAGGLALPTYYGSIAMGPALPPRCFAVPRVSEGRHSHVLDLDFFDAAGKPLARLAGIAVVPYRETSASSASSASADLDGPRVSMAASSSADRVASEGPKPPDAAAGPTEVAPDGTLSGTLQAIFARLLGGGHGSLDPRTGFFEMGMQSSQLLIALREIEKAFSLELNPTILFEHSNLAELGAFLASRGAVPPAQALPLPAARAARGAGRPWDIAVVGLSGRYPQSADLAAFWENLKAGRDCITEVPADRWDWRAHFSADRSEPGRHYSKWGGFLEGVADFDPLCFGIPPSQAELMDPQQRILLEQAWLALEDAGLTRASLEALGGAASPGKVGVYMGGMFQEYPLCAPDKGTGVDTGMSSLATRISWFWNLHGPSMAIDTACSSSLTAVYLACRDLAEGRIDAALAGGISLSLHPNKYLMLSQAQFISSRGHCAAFGADGDGYIPGEGAGVAVLKRLEDAERDGDRIYGVIKGGAINHGGKASGYTVPNPKAQQALVRDALASSGVDPATVSYVEAHGTGTSLGDPIEIAGLTGAFGPRGPGAGKCRIGSVKSNIGHCESAAGMAGLAKLLLQMRHGLLVPSLHAENPNPHIGMEASPFVVNRELRPWERPVIAGREIPRRGGISSFGAGGSNAHLIVEEYVPTAAEAGGDAGIQVFPLSAKGPERLRGQIAALARFLESDEALRIDPADLAFTLQTCREESETRFAVAAGTLPELAEALRNHAEGRPARGPVFAGTAGAEGNIGKAATEGARESVPETDPERVAAAWVVGARTDWAALRKGRTPRKLSVPSAPFARKRYWLPASAGTPSAETGSAAWIHPLLHRNVSDLESQRFATRFTGEEPFLAGHQVRGKRVLPAVAQLEMARAAAAACWPRAGAARIELSGISWEEPFAVSGESAEARVGLHPESRGTLAFTIESAGEEPVVHARGLAILAEAAPPAAADLAALRARLSGPAMDGDTCYAAYAQRGLSVGPGHRAIAGIRTGAGEALAELILPGAGGGAEVNAVSALRLLDGALQASLALDPDPGAGTAWIPAGLDHYAVFRPLEERMWAHLRELPQGAAASGTPAWRRFDIALYDAEGRICVSFRGSTTRPLPAAAGTLAGTLAVTFPGTTSGTAPGTIDVTASGSAAETLAWTPLWRALPPAAPYPYAERLSCLAGFASPRESSLAADLGETGISRLGTDAEDPRAVAAALPEASEKLADLFRSIILSKRSGRTLAQILVPGGLWSALSGLARAAGLEYPGLAVQVIACGDADNGAIRRALETLRGAGAGEYRLRDGAIESVYFAEREGFAAEMAAAADRLAWKEGGTYLISGGLGGLGLLFAREIAEQIKASTLILIGRSAPTAAQAETLAGLERAGARVRHERVDVADGAAMEALGDRLAGLPGGLQGILHCAGVLRDGLLLKKAPGSFAEALAPKVAGCVNLDRLAARFPDLDFLALFSSVSGVFGKVGQADYSLANAFLDAFARRADVPGATGARRIASINWPLWRAGGMGMSAEEESQLRDGMGMLPMEPAAGLAAFHAILSGNEPNTMVISGIPDRLRAHARGSFPREAIPAAAPAAPAAGDLAPFCLGLLTRALSLVAKIPAAEIDPAAPLERYGIDSVLILRLTRELEKSFGPLSKTLFYEYGTLAELRGHFLSAHASRLAELSPRGEAVAVVPALPAAMAASAVIARAPTAPAARFLPSARAGSSFQETPLDIAIVGLSGRYPQARDLAAFWDNLLAGRDCVTEIPADRWDWRLHYSEDRSAPGRHYSKWGGFLEGVDRFDPLFFGIPPREAERMDPQERLFLEQAWLALEDAGYRRSDLRALPAPDGDGDLPGQVGVYAAAMFGDYHLFGAEQSLLGRPMALGGSFATIANRVSYFLDAHGPSMTVDTMCSGSLTAIHLACQDLRLGRTALALAGGVNLTLHPNKYLALSEGQFVSGQGQCQAFGEGGDGYVPGEGVGVAVLKRLEDAVRDGDCIHAVIKGSAVNHGGKVNGYSVPNPKAQAAVIRRALRQSRVRPGDVGYVEAHGTGTRLGDPIEIAGLVQGYGADRAAPCWIGSAKSNIGHCESAAGIAGLTKLVLQMRHGRMAPSLHAATLNPNIDFGAVPFRVVREARAWERMDGAPFRAGLSSFGAGGSNAHLVLEEYRAPASAAPAPSLPLAITLSARTEERLRAYASGLARFAAASPDRSPEALARLARAFRSGREAMEERLGILASSWEELARKAADFAEGSLAEGCWRGHAKRNREAFALFATDEELRETLGRWFARGKTAALLEMWSKGLDFDWDRAYGDGPRPAKTEAPVYPFERVRCWPAMAEPPLPAGIGAAPRFLFQAKVWREADPVPEAPGGFPAGAGLALLAGEGSQGLARDLQARHFPGCRILADLGGHTEGLEACIDLTGCADREDSDPSWMTGLAGLIDRARGSKVRLLGVSAGLESHRNPAVNLAGSARAGLYRALSEEYAHVVSSCLDLDAGESGALRADRIASEYRAPLRSASICYRGGIRFEAALVAREAPLAGAGPVWFADASEAASRVLLITGGTRGIGYACARHFAARHGAKRLALLGRESLPPRERWEALAAGAGPEAGKLRDLIALEKLGAEVRILAGGLDDAEALAAALRKLESEFGPVGGVLHCAGHLDAGNPAFVRKEADGLRKVFAPKVAGLANLKACLDPSRLRFFALFSSVSAAMPALAAGQADYAAANAHMDYLAEALGGPFVSIQWPTWSEAGMAAGMEGTAAYGRSGLGSLSTAAGLEWLDRILAVRPGPVVLPMPAGLPESAALPGTSALPETTAHASSAKPASAARSRAVEQAAAPRSESRLEWLKGLFASEMRMPLERVDPETTFADYGLDSVLLTQFARKVNAGLSAPMEATALFEHPTLRALSAWLDATRGTLPVPASPVPSPVPSRGQSRASEPLPASAPSRPASEPGAESRPGPAAAGTRVPAFGGNAGAAGAVDIAVIGMAARFPGGESLDAYWDLLAGGRSAIAPDTVSGGHAARLGAPWDFDPAHFLIPMEDARAMDPQALVLLAEAWKAIHHAGYLPREWKGSATGVYLGARGLAQPDEAAWRAARNPILAVGQNYLAANLSRYFDWRGPSLVVDTACSSALVAMNLAIRDLLAGEIKQALVGGVSLLGSGLAQRVFAERKLAARGPEFHVFDRRADGAILGEGAGAVVLKPLEQALRDGDTVHAVIKALAINNDGRTAGPATPNLEAQKAVMLAALARSGLDPAAIGHIEANGSGTVVTDLLELKAIQAVYPGIPGLPRTLGSVKPNIGHPLCAEGIAGFLKAALMLARRARVPFLSGQAGLDHFDAAGAGLRFPRSADPWEGAARAAALNCFADGGTNAHVILSEAPAAAAAATRRPLPAPPLPPRAERPASAATAATAAKRVNIWKSVPARPAANRWKRSAELP